MLVHGSPSTVVEGRRGISAEIKAFIAFKMTPSIVECAASGISNFEALL
jgi:hypothetical protein